MYKCQTFISLLANVILVTYFAALTVACGQPSIPNLPNPLPENDITLPGPGRAPELPTSRPSQITLGVSEITAIIETREREQRSRLCAGVPRGGLPTTGVDYDAAIGSPGVGWIGIGYENGEDRGRERCAFAQSTVFHGFVEIDTQQLQNALDRYIIATDYAPHSVRILSATLRAKRKPSNFAPHDRCIIGRGAPLNQVLIDSSITGQTRADSQPVLDRPDLRLIAYQHNNFINWDGEDIGFHDFFKQDVQPTSRDEELNGDGSATLFYAATDSTLNALNARIATGLSGFPKWVTLLSTRNDQFSTNKDCLALYGGFRMNVTYEYVRLE